MAKNLLSGTIWLHLTNPKIHKFIKFQIKYFNIMTLYDENVVNLEFKNA